MTNTESIFSGGATATESVLVHFGKKGMKWGVRNDRGHEGEQAKTKKIAKLDQKFDKNAHSINTFIQVHNRAAQLSNDHDVEHINNKPEYKNADFRHDSPLRRQYYQEHQDAFTKNLERAASEMGTNASGTKKYSIETGMDGSWGIYSSSVQHSDARTPDFVVFPEYKEGRIVSISPPDVIRQGESFSENVLKHFGTKGMHWGQRKSAEERKAARSTPSTVKVISKPARRGSQEIKVGVRAGKQVRTVGGRRNLASEDAIKAAVGRQKAKASTTDALSNHELKTVVDRMQLETKYHDLAKKAKRQKPLGQRIAEAFLSEHGDKNLVSLSQALGG